LSQKVTSGTICPEVIKLSKQITYSKNKLKMEQIIENKLWHNNLLCIIAEGGKDTKCGKFITLSRHVRAP